MTIERNDILAVIPTYNNEKTLARVIGEVRRYCTDVLVVNDASGASPTPRTGARDTPCAGRCATPRSTATVTC